MGNEGGGVLSTVDAAGDKRGTGWGCTDWEDGAGEGIRPGSGSGTDSERGSLPDPGGRIAGVENRRVAGRTVASDTLQMEGIRGYCNMW